MSKDSNSEMYFDTDSRFKADFSIILVLLFLDNQSINLRVSS